MKKKLSFLLAVSFIALTGCGLNNGEYRYDDADKYIEYKEVTSISNFTSLNIDWRAGYISIQESNEDFFIKETNEGRGEYTPLYYYLDGETLNIRYCKSGIKNKDLNDISKKLEISVPSSLINMDIASLATDTHVKVHSIDKANIAITSGAFTLEVDQIKEFNSSIDAGETILKIKDTTLVNIINITGVAGSVEMYLDPRRGYDLNARVIVGTIDKEFEDGTDTSLSKYPVNVSINAGNLDIYKIS